MGVVGEYKKINILVLAGFRIRIILTRGVQAVPSRSVPRRPVPSRGDLGREIPVPKFFGTGKNRDGTKWTSGRDRDRDRVVPSRSRPEYIYLYKN